MRFWLRKFLPHSWFMLDLQFAKNAFLAHMLAKALNLLFSCLYFEKILWFLHFFSLDLLNYWVAWMELNLYNYHGFQLKITPAQTYATQCTTSSKQGQYTYHRWIEHGVDRPLRKSFQKSKDCSVNNNSKTKGKNRWNCKDRSHDRVSLCLWLIHSIKMYPVLLKS